MDKKSDATAEVKINGIENIGFTESGNNGSLNKDESNSFTSLDLNSDHVEESIPNDKNSKKIDSPPNNKKSTAELEITDKLNNDDESTSISNNNNKNSNIISLSIVKSRSYISHQFIEHNRTLKLGLIGTLTLLFHIYLIFAIVYNVEHSQPIDWCNGLGFLLILYGLAVWSFFYYFVLKYVLGKRIKKMIIRPLRKNVRLLWNKRYVSTIFTIAACLALIIFLIIDTQDQRQRLVSAFGVIVLIFVGLVLSKHPGHVQWRHVIWAIGLQFIFGLLILRLDAGRQILDCVSNKVKTFLDFTAFGTDFLYGYLSSGKPIEGLNFPPIFVFRALCVIYFFGFVISILYHYGVMQWVIVKLGWLLQITIGTTAAESMSAAANIFVGQVEAPLLIKPFLNKMTNSELNAVMTAGFATIAGTVMAAYISLGVSASYLLSASFMAAPAALGMAKLIYPETQLSKTTTKEIKLLKTESNSNAIDAAAQGAMQGTILIGCIIANIIAFVSFIAFLNAIVGWFGNLVGIEDLTFVVILGKCFVPVAWVIGIERHEADQVGRLLGLKTIANEFIAYEQLAGLNISKRSQAITTYALCSFANIGSLGIQLGGLGALLSPERRGDLAKTIGRAFLGGTLVGFLNACIAGCLLAEPGYDEWLSSQNSTTT